MKKTIVLLFLISLNFSFGQDGKIQLKGPEFRSGEENLYVYNSPKVIPENAMVKIAYRFAKSNAVKDKTIPLQKKEGSFEFKLNLPDSVAVAYLAVVDNKNTILDNNDNKGYLIYFKNKTKEELETANLSKLKIVPAANFLLKLKITPAEVVKQYEELFKANPKLSVSDNYLDYLSAKYTVNKTETAPKLLQEAVKLEKSKDEKTLTKALNIYYRLENEAKIAALRKRMLVLFPKGQTAKSDFWNAFYGQKDKTENSILKSAENYATKFNDNSQATKERFYTFLIRIYLENKDITNLDKYEKLIDNKLELIHSYNQKAWELSGEDLTSPGKDLDFAEKLSKRTLDIIKEKGSNPTENNLAWRYQENYVSYADTYALILFKQKKYDQAFELQDEISKIDNTQTWSRERYAAYAEKVKGLEFTKKFIETELASGVDSKALLNQLGKIYKNLNLPDTELKKISDASLKSVNKKRDDELLKRFGTTKAIDFKLTNLEGKTVSISDYKGKVVVLDFWATWCGPCRASFPGMQELVTKHKEDNIVFLFIDVWEKGEPEAIQKNAEKFIADNKYSFNVLLDFKNDLVTKYDIKGVPSKIVIDKEGNFASSNFFLSHDELATLIEENIK